MLLVLLIFTKNSPNFTGKIGKCTDFLNSYFIITLKKPVYERFNMNISIYHNQQTCLSEITVKFMHCINVCIVRYTPVNYYFYNPTMQLYK